MSKIEWCDETINPIIGCSKISPGCDNCYAEKMACRLAHMGIFGYADATAGPGRAKEGGINWFTGWNGNTVFRPSELEKPMHWKKPRKIFVTSMGDIFHESVSEWQHVAIFEMMRKAYWHTFFILTKRPEHMRDFILKLKKLKSPDYIRWPLPHVFLGVTAENQEQADIRIPILLSIPADTHFVSIEPMLGPVDLSPWLPNFLDFSYTTPPPRLDWVICGGESGPHARPMHPDWVRSIRNQCEITNAAFFFKQWGEYVSFLHTDTPFNPTTTNRIWMDEEGSKNGESDKADGVCLPLYKIGKKKAGRLLDGKQHNEFPEV